MAANGGVITRKTWRSTARRTQAARGTLSRHLVYSVPAPVPTGLQIVETLQILDNYVPTCRRDVHARRRLLPPASSKLARAGWRRADRRPRTWPVDLGNHSTRVTRWIGSSSSIPKKVYAAAGRPRRARARRTPSVGPLEHYRIARADRHDRVRRGRREGNMIAFTQTLSTWGGNYYVSKGSAFFTTTTSAAGGRGGGLRSMLPLMRSSSTSVPTLVFARPSSGSGPYGIPGTSPRLAVVRGQRVDSRARFTKSF
jgi:hypothetical protein